MSKHYDKDIINQIRRMDMTEFLASYMGSTFKRQGSDYRCIEHSSFVIRGDKTRWFWNSRAIGGSGAIDFLMKIENIAFPNAIEIIQSKLYNFVPTDYTKKLPKKDIFSLPDKGTFPYTNLIKYLCIKRGIQENIVNTLIIDNKIYQDTRGNVVFVGYDANNKPKFASLRGTGEKQFRMDCNGSDKSYNFLIKGTNFEILYIFESPIDMLSYLTLKNIECGNNSKWKEYSCLSLDGISSIALDSYIKRNNNIKSLIFCLDNDVAGQEAVKRMSVKYLKLGYKFSNILPQNKDFNEDLMFIYK